VHKDEGSYEEALRCFEQALAVARTISGKQNAEIAVCLNNLGLVHKDRGDYSTAKRFFEEALKISQAMHGEHHSARYPAQQPGLCAQRPAPLRQAQSYFEQALAITRRRGANSTPTRSPASPTFAFCSLVGRMPPTIRANSLFAEAQPPGARLRILARMYPESHPRMAEGFDSLGELLARQGEYVEAQRNFERALEIRQRVQESGTRKALEPLAIRKGACGSRPLDTGEVLFGSKRLRLLNGAAVRPTALWMQSAPGQC
jgi:tetratricopeptide (TPR) repeat protein